MLKSSNFIQKELGFSRQQLHYWRKIGIFSASLNTPGGHYRYGFQDLKSLNTIKLLRDAGISTHRIRKCFESIRESFPEIKSPFVEKPILVFGGRIVFVHKGQAYDALTGQSLLLDFNKIERWARKVTDISQYAEQVDAEENFLREFTIRLK